MFIELLIAILIGCFLGTITGLTPGIHINLVAALILLASPFALQHVGILFLVVVIIAMSIVHTFLDFIPSCYLGAPDADTALAALPGHVLLLQGKGFEAVKLATIGSLLCLILTIAAMPLLIFSVPIIFEFLKPYIGYILSAVVIFMILKESTFTKKFWSFFMFTLSGILGIVVFSLQMSDPLFPMLSGLFGLSMLTTSLSQKVNIPKQDITETIKVPKMETIKSLLAGTFSGSLVSIFPGMGPAQAAILGGSLIGKVSQHTYLILVGGINTVSMMLSLVTLYTIDKARNGSIIVVQELLKSIDLNILILFLAVSLITGGIGVFLTLKISKIFSKFITKVNYSALCLSVISFIVVLVYLFTGWLGLLVLVVSTAIGIIPGPLQIGRNHAMGCLLLPVILYFIL